MNIDRDGWLDTAQPRPSPNADERPQACVPELIVVHNISLPPGEFGGPWIDALFDNSLPADAHPYFADIAGLRVSAHMLIRRDGSMLQYVSFLRRAWHAGVSFYGLRERCNDFSIGIELEGADHVPYEDIQYERLAGVISALLVTYPSLSRERISGHSDIAPGRKTDPGPSFDWGRLRRELGRCLASRTLSPETRRIDTPYEDAS